MVPVDSTLLLFVLFSVLGVFTYSFGKYFLSLGLPPSALPVPKKVSALSTALILLIVAFICAGEALLILSASLNK